MGTPGVLRANKSVFLGEDGGTQTGMDTTTTGSKLLQTRNCEYHLLELNPARSINRERNHQQSLRSALLWTGFLTTKTFVCLLCVGVL